MSDEQHHRQRLASAVKQARLDRGWTQDDAADQSGLTKNSWRAVESGRPVRDLTYAAVERALGWPGGTCRRVLAGLEAPAAPAPPVDPQRQVIDLSALLDPGMRLLVETSRELTPLELQHLIATARAYLEMRQGDGGEERRSQ